MYVADRLTLDAPRRTADGYMAVRAKAARVGHYDYAGTDVDPQNAHGLRDQAVVKVLREENAVFDSASVRSFIGKPITDDHPTEAVTAANWRDHGRGVVMGAMRDGDHLAFDLILMDAVTIAKVEAGKVELSNGYSAGLEFGTFTAADGTVCQARQTSITGNHVAIVDRGRAGPSCRIGDAAPCARAPQPLFDSLTTQEKHVPNIMMIDGHSIDVANPEIAKTTIETLRIARDAATAELATAKTDLAAKDTQIATLTTEKKALEDAKPTPAQLRDAAKAYAQVVGKAKAIGVDVTDAMDEGAIMKAAVAKVMGDTAKDWNDAQIAASFAVVTKDAKVADTTVQPLGQPQVMTDEATAYVNDRAKQRAAITSAWKTPFNPAEAAAA